MYTHYRHSIHPVSLTLPPCVHYSHYRGRGAFESMGAGIAMAPGDIAFKCNYATLNKKTGLVEKRRAGACLLSGPSTFSVMRHDVDDHQH